MALVQCNGLMVLHIKDSGCKVKLMDMEDSYIQMGISTLERIKMTRQMAGVSYTRITLNMVQS